MPASTPRNVRSSTRAWVVLAGLAAGCGAPISGVVVMPGTTLGGQAHAMGDVLALTTPGWLDPDDALFLDVDGKRIRVDGQVVPLPLTVEEVFVSRSPATLHMDPLAADQGQTLLPFGEAITVAQGLSQLEPGVLLLVEEGAPKGFVRASETSSMPPTADDMLRTAKDALLREDLAQAREFARAAQLADSTHVGARRMMGALMIRDNVPEGFAMWFDHMPTQPKAVALPPPTPVSNHSRAYVYATDVSLRRKASTRSARMAMLDAGRVVDVQTLQGGWAGVQVVAEKGLLFSASIDPSEHVDGSNPWQGAEGMSAESQPGFMSAALLSSTPPDAAELSRIGIERLDKGAFMDAIVPLSRALAIDPDHTEARAALLRAAVEAEHFNIALSVVDLDVIPTADNAPGLVIQKIAGCHGELATARQRVLPAQGVLQEPKYRISDFEPGTLATDTIGDAACVTWDDAGGQVAFFDHVLDIEEWAEATLVEAPCDKDDCDFTREQRAQYANWKAARIAALKTEAVVHADYATAQERWSAQRAALFKDTAAVRIAITAERDMPAGALAVYSFDWEGFGWCGDLQSGGRTRLDIDYIGTPAIRTGQTLELWLEDTDMSRHWGFVFNDDLDGVREDMAQLSTYADSERPFDVLQVDLPESVTDRCVETETEPHRHFEYDCCGL